MDEHKFGDIVLLKFPFTDGLAFKKRAALVIQDSKDGDVIVCRVTSKLYQTLFDKIGQLEKITQNKVKHIFKKLVI